MAFMNCFLNLNINIGQPRFGFNFGCFSMPNFFSNMPIFNFNYFSPMSGFQEYSNFSQLTMPSVYSSLPSFNQNSASIFLGSSFNGNLQTQYVGNFDEFTWSSIDYSIGKKETKRPPKKEKEYTYSNNNDKFADSNRTYLKNLTSEMQDRTKKLIAYANANGYDVKITSGYRTQEAQDKLRAEFEAKGETGRAAKVSAHTSGKAIDIEVYKNGQKCNAGYDLLGEYAVSELGMRWGGNFSSYVEKWHFDYGWRAA